MKREYFKTLPRLLYTTELAYELENKFRKEFLNSEPGSKIKSVHCEIHDETDKEITYKIIIESCKQ